MQISEKEKVYMLCILITFLLSLHFENYSIGSSSLLMLNKTTRKVMALKVGMFHIKVPFEFALFCLHENLHLCIITLPKQLTLVFLAYKFKMI